MNISKKAVLDLGTNTFHLLIAEIAESQITPVVQQTTAVKLGEGGINQGFITESASERGINAIKNYAQLIEQYGVTDINAVGTAALRNATNGMQFINRVRQETGINIQIIDGTLEAELIYEGVKHGVRLNNDTVLIMDIGGGSVEFIIGNAENIIWRQSYALGAAKLMDLFHRDDPINSLEVDRIEEHISTSLAELKALLEIYQPDLLIGSAGAFETFAALIVSFFDLPEGLLREKEFDFNLNQYGHISHWILNSTHAERAAKPEIIPVRVDMIVVATILTNYVLREFKFDRMKLSTYALKEGLLFQKPSISHS